MKLYIVNFRKCPSTALSLVVNQILLIKMSAFTGDMIHIEEIYVCTGADTGFYSSGGGCRGDRFSNLYFFGNIKLKFLCKFPRNAVH